MSESTVETTTHECPHCGDVHLPKQREDAPQQGDATGHFEHEPDCVLGVMERHPEDRRPCWRCGGRWVEP